MTANHKETSKSLLQQWGDNTPHKATSYLSPNYKNHQMPDAGSATSCKSLKEWQELVTEFHKGFSDVKMEILLQVAEGDYVCTRWRMTAKHTGKFMQYEPTGKTTTWTGIHTDLYEKDKMVESWVDWDKYSFLEQLGLTD